MLLWNFLKVSEKYFPQCGAENQIKGVDIAGDVWKICKEKSLKNVKQCIWEICKAKSLKNSNTF